MKYNKFMTINSRVLKILAACLLISNVQAGSNPRVIAIGPSVNNIVAALAAKDNVVGVDMQSMVLYPKTVNNIGYQRALNLEGLLSLKPDLCIASYDASPMKVINELNHYKVRTVITAKITTPDSVYANIELVGKAIGKQQAALDLKNKVAMQTTSAIHSIPLHKPLNALFLLQISDDQVFMLGDNTHGNWWLNLMQVNNVATFSGMRPLSREGLLALNPDLILIAKANDKLELPYKSELNSYTTKNKAPVITMNADLLEGFGADFGNNVKYLVNQIYHAKK